MVRGLQALEDATVITSSYELNNHGLIRSRNRYFFAASPTQSLNLPNSRSIIVTFVLRRKELRFALFSP
jgi:hypothetical protein